jgi:hypothetical protein
MIHCNTHISLLLVMQFKTQKLELQITADITHEESLPITL